MGLYTTTITAQDTPQPPTRLELNQVKHITDDHGHIIPKNILPLEPGNLVRIKLLDGTELIGCVGVKEEAYRAYVKLTGIVLNVDGECEFGIVANAEGELKGAIAFKNSQKVYVIKYNETAKAFVFDLQPYKPKEHI